MLIGFEFSGPNHCPNKTLAHTAESFSGAELGMLHSTH